MSHAAESTVSKSDDLDKVYGCAFTVVALIVGGIAIAIIHLWGGPISRAVCGIAGFIAVAALLIGIWAGHFWKGLATALFFGAICWYGIHSFESGRQIRGDIHKSNLGAKQDAVVEEKADAVDSAKAFAIAAMTPSRNDLSDYNNQTNWLSGAGHHEWVLDHQAEARVAFSSIHSTVLWANFEYITGRAYYFSGQNQAALDRINTALKTRPYTPPYLLGKAAVLVQLGRCTEAVVAFDDGLSRSLKNRGGKFRDSVPVTQDAVLQDEDFGLGKEEMLRLVDPKNSPCGAAFKAVSDKLTPSTAVAPPATATPPVTSSPVPSSSAAPPSQEPAIQPTETTSATT